MNLIMEAILYNEHISDNEKLNQGDWKTFYAKIRRKKLIVFGAGAASKKLTDKFLRGKEIVCFLDNDPKKQGTEYGGVPIKVPSDLDKAIYKQSVVLITSTVFMDEIAQQLEKMGVEDYYAVLAMEAKQLKNKILTGLIKLFLYHVLPIQKNKIVFRNHMDRYGCNLKYISQALHEKYPKYKLVWLTERDGSYPDYIKCVRNTKMGFLYHIATAKVWVFNDVQHYGITKRKGQYFINTWHGNFLLKKAGLDADRNSKKNYRDVVATSEKTDIMISNGTSCNQMYKDMFQYCGRTWEFGSPRLDIVFRGNPQIEQYLRKKFGISPESKVVLYAPTFRGMGVKANVEKIDVLMLDFKLLREKLSQAYGQDISILLRLHPLIADAGERLEESKGVINVTDYEDVYELLLIVDILVTDYSSLMFEAGVVGKEVYLYTADIERYMKEERGFYIDYYELPYPIATTQEELIENMCTTDYAVVAQKVSEFMRLRGVKESGNASEATADAIDLMVG